MSLGSPNGRGKRESEGKATTTTTGKINSKESAEVKHGKKNRGQNDERIKKASRIKEMAASPHDPDINKEQAKQPQNSKNTLVSLTYLFRRARTVTSAAHAKTATPERTISTQMVPRPWLPCCMARFICCSDCCSSSVVA